MSIDNKHNTRNLRLLARSKTGERRGFHWKALLIFCLVLAGCTTWGIAKTGVAYAAQAPGTGGSGSGKITTTLQLTFSKTQNNVSVPPVDLTLKGPGGTTLTDTLKPSVTTLSKNKVNFTTTSQNISIGKWQVCAKSPMINNTQNQTCKTVTVQSGKTVTASMSESGTAASLTPASGSGSAAGADTCNMSGSPITWILCPIFDGIGSLSDFLLNNVIKSFLQTNPISTNPQDSIYKIWSAFRIWGDIFLVIAMLVIVFGQAIGGGVVDAYTAKKVLPRLLIAAILINLSIYLVAFAVDVTNVIGSSVGNIMTAPLDGVSLSPSGFKLGIFAAVSTIAGVGAGILGFLAFMTGGTLVVGIALTQFLPFLLLFVILPAFLAVCFVFIILILRQAIIIALVLTSPIAFALYCLPNTEQYFKKWWGLLLNMLMVYPIIMIIFAAADILAYTTIKANGTDSFWGYFVAFLLQFLPLFLIPYAFKLAGGVLGRIHDVAVGHGKSGVEALKGDARDPWSRRNRYKRMASNQALVGRENLVDRGNAMQGKNRGKFAGVVGKGMAGVAGSGNYEDLRSRRNREASEMLQGHIATGGDKTVRALFAEKKGGVWTGANGTEYTDSEHSKAVSLYGRDPSMYQAAYSYELGKAANDDELEETEQRHERAMDSLSVPGKDSVTAGAHWSHQQTRRELKHTKRKQNSLTGNVKYIRSADAFSQEVAENVGNYPLGNMRTSTIKALQEDYTEAGAAVALAGGTRAPNVEDAHIQALQAKIAENPEYLVQRGLATAVKENETFGAQHVEKATKVRRFVTSTADSLDSRYQRGGTYALEGEHGDQPVSGSQSGAPGLVNEQIGNLVKLAATPRPPSPQGGQGGGPSTPPGDYRGGGRGYL